MNPPALLERTEEFKMRPTRCMRCASCCALLIVYMLLYSSTAAASQKFTWTVETVDTEGGTFNSMAVDPEGNVHMGYLSPSGGGAKYAFRSAASGSWFSMVVDGNNGFVSLALDSHQRPSLCYMPFQTLKYARWDGSKWEIGEIAPRSGARDFSCSICIDRDDAPHVTWYQYRDSEDRQALHIRHAALQNGNWLARTLDYGRETGKWNTVRVDSQGHVYVAYSAFREGAFRFASSDSKGNWTVHTVEDGRKGRGEGTTPGMGNSMVIDQNGKPNFAYRDETTLRYAWPDGEGWRIDVVDPDANPSGIIGWAILMTSVAMDSKGRPHIVYQADGSLKHAWWDGTKWQVQAMGIHGSGLQLLLYASLAISRDDVIYISYSDPQDGSLKVLVGRPHLEETSPANASK